jgi:peptidoglycan L-alanyl-D-glutamate endopeptidase CwlK|tara:strand:+ start:1685 stop:2071 length:387 start_codon:yes stop_codon:yes gene_type:complete
MFQLGKNSVINMAGIDSRLMDIVEVAIKLSNIDFGIPSSGGLRTTEDQAALFTAGKSKCDGRTNKSYHQTGKAVDVYAYVDGKASWDHLHLTHIATAMLQASAQLGYELKWGGLWNSWQDMPHFEIKD